MSWFSETKIRESALNGAIVAKRHFGMWEVQVDHCEQTGPEVHAVWKDGFRKVRQYSGGRKIKKILALGLGAGGEIKNIHKNFPQAALTVIEYDPEMIALAKELRLNRPFPFPDVICEDAKTALPRLSEEYDLIVLDLFRGAEPSPLAADEAFHASLASKLAPQGLLIANVYRKPEYLETLAKNFDQHIAWRFNQNHVGLFQKKNGLSAEGYIPKELWPEFDAVSAIPKFLQPAHIGKDNAGTYWKFWPFSFEEYRGDMEPEIRPLPPGKRAPIRVVMWQRYLRTSAPKSWWYFSPKPYRMTGFAEILPEHRKRWSETARRNVREWEKNFLGKKYAIEPVEREDFSKAYLKSTLPFFTRRAMNDELKARAKNMRAPLAFYAARRIEDKKIVAGIALMNSPSVRISYYLAGFYLNDAKEEPVMPGLFDHWFKESLKGGVRFLDLGNFWKEGEPSAWKGFSAFKAKFGPTYFFYKPKLYRFSIGP